MKFSITRRDIKIFLLGVITTLAIVFISDWTNNIKDVKDGFADGISAQKNK